MEPAKIEPGEMWVTPGQRPLYTRIVAQHAPFSTHNIMVNQGQFYEENDTPHHIPFYDDGRKNKSEESRVHTTPATDNQYYAV